jgi:tRNA A-37 threonylcarbamoyl transferase component Bud32
MSSTSALKDANKLISVQGQVLSALSDPKSLIILHLLYKRGARSVGQIADELPLSTVDVEHIVTLLEESNLVYRQGDNFTLTLLAQKRISYGSISLEFLVGSKISMDTTKVAHALRSSYIIKECIGKGATSYTFRAEQSGTYRDRTLKIFLPNMVKYDQLDEALQKRARIQRGVALPEIFEAGQVDLQFPDGRNAVVPCVVLEYINGGAKTFAEYLRSHENLNSIIFERFVERVGNALAAIEDVGLSHSDLHEGNILVAPGASPAVEHDFWVIDFISVPSTISPELEITSDIENFCGHLLRAAIIASERYPGYSARLLLGERVFRVLEGLRKFSYKTFRDMLQDFNRENLPIPKDHFREPAPAPFEWLRVEWIPSPQWLFKLFEPVLSRFDTISRFGNTWISGPRGCGKSHYLRVMAFQPLVIIEAEEDKDLAAKLKIINYDFRKAFGILFACRLGEFKGFSPEAIGKQQFDVETQAFLKHIIILKIWNKTLNTIREGLESLDSTNGKHVIEMPHEISKLYHFLEEKLGTMALMSDSNPISIFLQCLATSVARENSAIAVWNYPSKRPIVRLLDESDLDEFFAVLKETFPDLNQTRFYVLVDDASYGHIHFEMQKILNSLVRAAQANHCFKITCDKFMYTLDTADGRSIDPRHEVTYVDLGEVSTKAQRETLVDLSEYMAKVIDLRLKAAGYTSTIQTILGRSQDAQEFLSALSLPGARRPKKGEKPERRPPRTKAYYAGWNIVWSISHGSVRTLLEMVEHIFKTNKMSKDTTSISLEDQDTAVRSYANRHFKALSMLPGEFEGEILGNSLQAVIGAIGEVSRKYLEQYDTGEENRWYETISIERLDQSQLNQKAQTILHELVKFGLLLDEGVTFSRAQFGLSQRYDMNKIFAPAFQTTYRVRNHMYLSRELFEELLLHPHLFVERHQKKLSKLAQHKGMTHQKTLFGNDDYD